MKIYKVGGCVRDELLGAPVRDVDWVVVGATPARMSELGYQQVGADFPVFLHPRTHEEYALARKERKVGPGHKGFETSFDPSVTLEEDLSRRDLTVNAMAMDPATGEIVDPFGGRADLAAGVLRHVSEAFAEDPLRVLRLARFQARMGFAPHPGTLDLCRQICESGALRDLSMERVRAELGKLFDTGAPQLGLGTLLDVGALGSLDASWPSRLSRAQLDALGSLARARAPEWALARIACCAGMGSEAAVDAMARLKFPNDVSRWCGRVGALVEWARERAGETKVDFERALLAVERAGASKFSPSEAADFAACAAAELSSMGCPARALALADRAVRAAPAVAAANLADALARPKSELPAAVRAAKRDALRDRWGQVVSDLLPAAEPASVRPRI